jgi:hypothetical protein
VEGVRGGEEKVGSVRSWKEVCLVTGGQNGGVVGDNQLLYIRSADGIY